MKKENAIIAIIAAAVLGAIGGRFTAKPSAPAPTAAAAPETVKADALPAAAAAPTKVPSIGPETAKVTIVEISDFQCPFCSRAYTTLEDLRKQYPNDVRVVFINQPLPFHQNAKPAAIAATAAGKQGKFWEMYSKLFPNQQQLSDANYQVWGKEIGLDMTKFAADLKDPEVAKTVERDMAVATGLGVRGTPGFFINGVNVSGAQPIENFKKIIDEQITKANDEIGKGAKAGPELVEKLTRVNNPALGDNLIKWVFKGETPPANAAPADAAKPGDKQPNQPPPDDKTVWKVVLRGDEPVKGKADAPITIVEYTDFQCPFCSKVLPALEETLKNYPDKVKLVFKNYPLSFHQNAMPAAEAAQCAKEQGKFWEVEEKYFGNQGELDAAGLAKHAQAAGVNMGKWEACVKDHKFKSVVEADMAAAEKIQVTGTPSVFVQGRKMVAGRAPEDFKRVVDEELAKADALIKSGTAAKDVYAKMVADGKEFTPPPPLDPKVNNFDYDGSPILGDKNAKIKIVEYKDFQCPFCAKIIPTLKQVQKEVPGVAIVFKNFPLSNQCNPKMSRDMHPAACLAMYWAFAAQDQGKFWEFEDLVYNNYSNMMPPDGDMAARQAAQETKLKGWAKDVGMDVAKADAYVKAKKYQPRLDKDLKEAESAEVRGTPSLYVNGRSYNGPMQADKMKEILKKVSEGKL